MNKTTLVLGASTNPERTSYTAIHKLHQHGHTVLALGREAGEVDGTAIATEWPEDIEIDTVSIYLNPDNQAGYKDHIIKTHPKRVIFNPGAENHELEADLVEYDIDVIEACTLVLLATEQF